MIGSYIERRHFGPDWAQRHAVPSGPISDWLALSDPISDWLALSGPISDWLAHHCVGWPIVCERVCVSVCERVRSLCANLR